MWLKRIGPALLLLLWGSGAHAQVNVEVLRKELTESGWSAKADASVTYYSGNTEGIQLGGSALVGVRSGVHLAYVNGTGQYTHLGGELSVARTCGHARYNLELLPWLWLEVFAQAESDQFRSLRLRQLFGVGLRAAVGEGDVGALYYGTSYMLEQTVLSEEASQVRLRPDFVHRSNHYASASLNLDEDRIKVTNTLYYQPRFDRFSDYRLLDIASLDVQMWKAVSLGIRATLRYESLVPEDVKSHDLSVTNTLSVTL